MDPDKLIPRDNKGSVSLEIGFNPPPLPPPFHLPETADSKIRIFQPYLLFLSFFDRGHNR